VAGGAAGYVENALAKWGETGTPYLVSHQTYKAHTYGGVTTYLVAETSEYPSFTTIDHADDAPDRLTTTYSYQLFVGNSVQEQTITDPSGNTTSVFYDDFGRPIWTKDGAGYINHTEYDQVTGAVVKTITDTSTVDSTTGWTPLSGITHLNLTTTYEVDSQGRTTKITDAKREVMDANGNVSSTSGDVTYAVYLDAVHEVRTYPGRATAS
jgi:YD repeat-containing protein